MWGHYALYVKVGARGHEMSPERSFLPQLGMDRCTPVGIGSRHLADARRAGADAA